MSNVLLIWGSMSKVTILPENLCNMIAAGEVVERPASVIKELLENALDARASEILVEVESGGKKLMRVTDDGEGMARDDAFLCLERHATSKIRTAQDLAAISTLGFRGEALPAIASVSRLTLRTCGNDQGEGLEIYLEGGTVRKSQDLGLPRGTCVEVRNLFFNTPARRKFLRRDETELGHIADVVTRQALAHPQVRFRLEHNGRQLFEVRRNSSLPERIGAFLGRSLIKDLVAVQAAGADVKLHGFVCPPLINRSSSSAVYTFINGRYVRDRVVQHAILEGYRHLLMKGRYPVTVLFLEIAPSQVDVNVHPTKHEVRFRDQGAVHDFIVEAVRHVLRVSPGLRQESLAPAEPLREIPQQEHPAQPSSKLHSATERVQEALLSYASKPQRPEFPVTRPGLAKPPASREPLPSQATGQAEGFFSTLRYLGQYRNSYLLCQDADDLVLIDQHAAHERIRFESLRNNYQNGTPANQALLFPQVVEFDFKGAALLTEHLPMVQRLGFDIEPFGGKSFAVKSVPTLLLNADVERLLRDLAADLDAVGQSGAAADVIDDVLMRLACHDVVRANQALNPAEVQALFRALDQVDFQAHCPHGRPVLVRLTLSDIERLFRRT